MGPRDKELKQHPIWAVYAPQRPAPEARVGNWKLIATCRAADEAEAIEVFDDSLAGPDRQLFRIGEW
jgi:hypothetical protein